jgi:hypothetical protein
MRAAGRLGFHPTQHIREVEGYEEPVEQARLARCRDRHGRGERVTLIRDAAILWLIGRGCRYILAGR